MTGITEEDRARLSELTVKDWVEAAISRDWDASLALCSDDVVYMPQDHPELHGKDQLRAYLESFPGITRMTQSIGSLSGAPDLAVIRGNFELAVKNEGQELSGTGKFLTTASKRSGDWLVTSACFNFDSPLTPTG